MKENWENNWKDYYQILQLHPSAEQEVVKAAYDRLAHKYHPDINKDPTASARMKDLNEAFEIISNPIKRIAYDTQYNKVHIINPPITNPPKQETNVTYNVTRPQPKPDTPRQNNLTLDEKLKFLFIMLSNDRNIKFREREWRKKRDEVREWLKPKGTASKLGECPFCKLKSVLANSDASAGRCINPKCSYQIY